MKWTKRFQAAGASEHNEIEIDRDSKLLFLLVLQVWFHLRPCIKRFKAFKMTMANIHKDFESPLITLARIGRRPRGVRIDWSNWRRWKNSSYNQTWWDRTRAEQISASSSCWGTWSHESRPKGSGPLKGWDWSWR